jgi:hypothetical protein
MTPKVVGEIKDLGERLARAQLRADANALGALLTDEFKVVGPAGFVLDKQQWIEQYSSGRLEVRSLDWDELDVRVHDQVAIAIGRQSDQVTFQSQPAGGEFRVTQVAVQVDGEWRLLGLHLSPIAQATGAVAGGVRSVR